MLKVIWNSFDEREKIGVSNALTISYDLKSSLSALLNNDSRSYISESEKEQLLYKLQRLEWETEFIEKHRQSFYSLTQREREVMQLLLEGHNNPQIARELFISRRTVEQHRKNINRKLKIRSSVDFFAFGYAFNLV